MQRFFQDDGFQFATLIALGSAYRGLADVGEILSTVARIPEADREAWVREFSGTAERLAADADVAEKRNHSVSARAKLLRASLYFDLASSMAPGTSDPNRFTALWEQSRRLWDRSLPMWPIAVERLAIPYENTQLEGYAFYARPKNGPRPTLILNNGSDGPVNAMWSQGGAAAVERGWLAVTFDGPGQGAALHRQGLYFRHDWEAVISPVVDFLLNRADVDPDRIVLHGVSQAGYWVPRAAAFEHRLAAIVADPGVVDVAASWLKHLPKEMIDLLDAGEKETFDGIMEAETTDPAQKAELLWRMAPYGTTSYYEAFQAARRMSLDDAIIASIQCPTLITDPDDEQFWPGQSQALYDKLACKKELVRFTKAEGANWHCEVVAQALRDERVFDWLEEVLGLVNGRHAGE